MASYAPEYRKQARDLVAEKGRMTPTEIIKEIGNPPPGIRLKSDGRGSVTTEPIDKRRARKEKAETKRQSALQVQTVGPDVYGKGVVAPKGSQLQEHHKRVVGLYKLFFEGLNPAETKELAQWFVDEGAPLGNVQKNLEALTEQEHESIHAWMKKHRMQVSNKKFPSFKNVPLNERFPAVLTYLEQIQPAADEELVRIKQSRLIDQLNLTPAERRALNAADLKGKDELLTKIKAGKSRGAGSPMGTQLIGGPMMDIMPPSQEGYGPGGIIRTIPTAHERL